MNILSLIVFAILIFCSQPIHAQIKTSFKYSEDIEQQINTAKQVEEQFRQFRKDSSKIVKRQFKRLKKTADSLVSELKKQATLENLKSLSPEVSELTKRQQQAMAIVRQKFSQAKKYSKINKKELQSMVMQNIENRPEFEEYKSIIESELLPYKSQFDKYKAIPQSADSIKQQIKDFDLDSADLWQQLDEFVASEAMKTNYYQAFMNEQGQLTQLQSNPQTLFTDNAPKFDFANHPLKEAKQAGMKHFDKINENIDKGVEQIDQLKKKYAYVPDSEDLKTAKKSNSLSGVPAKKRIVFGGNFHLDIGDPLFLDFNPILGYKVDKKWTLGIGGTIRFRLSHTDSTDFQYRVPTTGLRGFGEYRFFKSFLAHAEYEVLANDVFSSETINKVNKATQSINIGLGSTFGIYKGLKGKFLILYNIILDGEIQYKSPWVVRFGFLN